jgi:hypothetical protein
MSSQIDPPPKRTATPEDPTLKSFRSRQSAGVWTAGAVLIGVISVGSSFAQHSLPLTLSLLFGVIAVWYVGYWILSKNLYYVSSTKAGFKDLFRSREVQFDEVRSATISVGRDSRDLIFECDGDTVRMPLDPMDESWLSAVKTELSKHGISVSTRAYGFQTTG